MQPTIEQAVKAHREGKLEEAKSLYLTILQDQPRQPDANHNLGVIALSVNKLELALPLLKTALEINPSQGQYWLSYINALIKAQQLDTARNVLEQGKKMGLGGDLVDKLCKQITYLNNDSKSDQNQGPVFNQSRKKLLVKSGKKKKQVSFKGSPLQNKGPNQDEVSTILTQYQSGRYEAAEKLAIEITKKYPSHQFGWKALGAIFNATGKPQDALKANQKAAMLVPTDVESHNNLGNTLKELGKLTEAEASYRQAIALKPDLAEAHSNLGNVLKELGKLAEAEASCRKAIALKPSYALAHYNLGNTLKEQNKIQDAVESYREAIALKPEYPQAYSNLGAVLQDLGQLNEAEASYRQAIALKPDLAEAHGNLGIVLRDLDRLVEAKESLRMAIYLKPDYAIAHYNLGNTLKELKQLKEAEACFREAIKHKPDYAPAYYNLGNILKNLNNLEDAEASYRKSIALEPGLTEAHYNLGNTLQGLGKLEDAETSFSRAITLKKDYALAYNNLGNTQQELGKLADAEINYRQAITIEPTYAPAHNNLGSALLKLGKITEAETSLKQSIALNPDALNVYANLGIALTENCKLKEAEDLFSEILPKTFRRTLRAEAPVITALLAHGRSGSLFFHSLFDGHPELATLPGLYLTGWFNIDSWMRFAPEITRTDWRENLISAFINEHKSLFDANCKENVFGKPMGSSLWLAEASGFMTMGPEQNKPLVIDQQAFSAALLSLLKPLSSITSEYFFELIHRAFEIGIRGRSDKANQSDCHILYHFHNPRKIETANFLQYYPNARILLSTRNPIQSLESWLISDSKMKIKNQYPGNDEIGESIDGLVDSLGRCAGKIVDVFMQMQLQSNGTDLRRGVRLEDLKRNSQNIIPQIADWMGISDHPSLYESSFCGMQYWGPRSPDTGPITGFDTKAVDKAVGQILGPRDILIFETLFWPFSSLYGYTEMDEANFHTNLSVIRPWLQEPLEFEKRLSEALGNHKCSIEDLGPYKRLHHFLNQIWNILDKEKTFKNMPKPLKLD